MKPSALAVFSIVSLLLLAIFGAGCLAAGASSRQSPRALRAIVLGGGGPPGAAWEIGMLKGLRDGGVDLSDADLFVGTSAGSFTGALVRSGKTLDDLYQWELTRGILPNNPLAFVSLADSDYYADTTAMVVDHAGSTPAFRVEVGRKALATPHPIPEETWRARFKALLDADSWPSRPLKMAAVDVGDGAVRFFDKTQGVPLETAIAASSALPGLVAPITVGDRRYMDGYVAGTNLSGALGYRVIVVLAPFGGSKDIELVRSNGSQVIEVGADAAAISAASSGSDILKAWAEAGFQQAAAVLDDVRTLWNGGTPSPRIAGRRDDLAAPPWRCGIARS